MTKPQTSFPKPPSTQLIELFYRLKSVTNFLPIAIAENGLHHRKTKQLLGEFGTLTVSVAKIMALVTKGTA